MRVCVFYKAKQKAGASGRSKPMISWAALGQAVSRPGQLQEQTPSFVDALPWGLRQGWAAEEV